MNETLWFALCFAMNSLEHGWNIFDHDCAMLRCIIGLRARSLGQAPKHVCCSYIWGGCTTICVRSHHSHTHAARSGEWVPPSPHPKHTPHTHAHPASRQPTPSWSHWQGYAGLNISLTTLVCFGPRVRFIPCLLALCQTFCVLRQVYGPRGGV